MYQLYRDEFNMMNFILSDLVYQLNKSLKNFFYYT